MGGWPALGGSATGPTGGPPGGYTPGVMEPGPPPRTATPWMGPSKNWMVGDYTPATYTKFGYVDSWKQVQEGDINPWDKRIATASEQEWRDFGKNN
eukprot:16435115-Heterocapsa_arctica.AAC.1